MENTILENTILKVTENYLCTGCGTCIALCPKKAIKMNMDHIKGIYIPKIEEKSCNNCKICYRVCPGKDVDFRQLNMDIFGKEPENFLVGNYLNCYIAYSNDPDIRFNSSSGGIITQILLFALEEGIIDGVLVTRMKNDNPLEPEPFIARTKEEIIEASKSKYCPVPLNIILNEVLASKDNERFALVGLPCHIHGLKKAEKVEKKLVNKIVFTLGIFCGHVPNFLGTEIFLKRLNIPENEIVSIDYRGDGWPGFIKIRKINNETIKMPSSDYWNFAGSYFFYPNRCLTCVDETCEFSDISLGDAWLPKYSDDHLGTSILVSRSKMGESILRDMSEKNKITLNGITSKEVIKSQQVMLYYKKTGLNLMKYLLAEVPFYGDGNNIQYPVKWDITSFFIHFFMYLNFKAASFSIIRKILVHIPFKIIWYYYLPIRILAARKAEKMVK